MLIGASLIGCMWCPCQVAEVAMASIMWMHSLIIVSGLDCHTEGHAYSPLSCSSSTCLRLSLLLLLDWWALPTVDGMYSRSLPHVGPLCVWNTLCRPFWLEACFLCCLSDHGSAF